MQKLNNKKQKIKGGSNMLRLNGFEIQTERFPNNETKVKDFEQHILGIGEKNSLIENVLEFKYFNDEDLVLLMFVKQRIDEFNVPCTLFIWYMSYSRMDRKIEGDLFNLKYVCNFINWLNFEKVVVMEPHSEKTVQLLKRVTPIYPVKDWVKPEKVSDDVQIVFPDKGAAARYKDCNYKNVCIMEKTRNPYNGWITGMELKEGKVIPGAKCVIIDDLCCAGGTFLRAANILKENGASEVVLVVFHCEETIFNGKLLNDDSPISEIYTSKSIMDKEHPKIHYMDVNVMEYVYGKKEL
jgi:ribose-phosphate pyrophosphokinase